MMIRQHIEYVFVNLHAADSTIKDSDHNLLLFK